MKIITYTSADEVLVTTLANEHELIREYFGEGGRDDDDYDRLEVSGVLEISTHITARQG